MAMQDVFMFGEQKSVFSISKLYKFIVEVRTKRQQPHNFKFLFILEFKSSMEILVSSSELNN